MLGILIWNGQRPDIALENGALYGGLHCGDCLCYYENGWIDVRLELLDDWVFVRGQRTWAVQYGAAVRI